MRVPLGYARLELHWWDDHLAREPIHAFPDRFSAQQFLMRLKDDPGVMASLRKLLAERDDRSSDFLKSIDSEMATESGEMLQKARENLQKAQMPCNR